MKRVIVTQGILPERSHIKIGKERDMQVKAEIMKSSKDKCDLNRPLIRLNRV